MCLWTFTNLHKQDYLACPQKNMINKIDHVSQDPSFLCLPQKHGVNLQCSLGDSTHWKSGLLLLECHSVTRATPFTHLQNCKKTTQSWLGKIHGVQLQTWAEHRIPGRTPKRQEEIGEKMTISTVTAPLSQRPYLKAVVNILPQKTLWAWLLLWVWEEANLQIQLMLSHALSKN